MVNFIANLRVGTVAGTVVSYNLNDPVAGTLTVSFDDSGFTSGTAYKATFTATAPVGSPVTATSTNSYTKP